MAHQCFSFTLWRNCISGDRSESNRIGHSAVSESFLSHLGGLDGKVSGPENVTGVGILQKCIGELLME